MGARRAGSAIQAWVGLTACVGVLAVGCNEGGAVLTGAVVAGTIDFPDGQGEGVPPGDLNLEGDPSAIEVQGAKLRSAPGGCEVDVTFRNVSTRTASAGFRYDILDALGQRVTSRDTAVQSARPGQVRTVSSEGTTAGPSSIPCPEGGQPRLVHVSVWNL